MNITNFHEKVYEVNNDIPYLVHQLFSAVDLLRIVVEKSEDEGLLESCPLAGLRGVLNLLDHVGDQFGKLEIRSEEVLKLQEEIRTARRTIVTGEINAGLMALGYILADHNIAVEQIDEPLCVVVIDGKRFGIWDANRKTFVD